MQLFYGLDLEPYFPIQSRNKEHQYHLSLELCLLESETLPYTDAVIRLVSWERNPETGAQAILDVKEWDFFRTTLIRNAEDMQRKSAKDHVRLLNYLVAWAKVTQERMTNMCAGKISYMEAWQANIPDFTRTHKNGKSQPMYKVLDLVTPQTEGEFEAAIRNRYQDLAPTKTKVKKLCKECGGFLGCTGGISCPGAF